MIVVKKPLKIVYRWYKSDDLISLLSSVTVVKGSHKTEWMYDKKAEVNFQKVMWSNTWE